MTRIHQFVPKWSNFLGQRSHRAFTLVELLIVIAVVAILTGVLAPSLGEARRSAQGAKCASNVRQLQLANDLFATDHKDHYVPGAARFQTQNLERWHGTRASVAEPFSAASAPLTSYIDGGAVSKAIRSCPSFRPSENGGGAHLTAGFEASAGGYGYNNEFVGAERYAAAGDTWHVRTDCHGSTRARFNDPSATIAFTDAAFVSGGLIEYSFVEPRRWSSYPEYRPDPSIHFRHSGNCNVVWLDGHVSLERMTYSESSGLYEGQASDYKVGWFGESDDNRFFDYQ